jgi:hypothetical protein
MDGTDVVDRAEELMVTVTSTITEELDPLCHRDIDDYLHVQGFSMRSRENLDEVATTA